MAGKVDDSFEQRLADSKKEVEKKMTEEEKLASAIGATTFKMLNYVITTDGKRYEVGKEVILNQQAHTVMNIYTTIMMDTPFVFMEAMVGDNDDVIMIEIININSVVRMGNYFHKEGAGEETVN